MADLICDQERSITQSNTTTLDCHQILRNIIWEVKTSLTLHPKTIEIEINNHQLLGNNCATFVTFNNISPLRSIFTFVFVLLLSLFCVFIYFQSCSQYVCVSLIQLDSYKTKIYAFIQNAVPCCEIAHLKG